jgi:site-specific recombinase XerD
MATINFELRNRPDRQGYCALRVCIQDKKKRRFLPLQIKLKPSEWDRQTQRVKSTHPKAGVINNVLKLKLADLQGNMATEMLNKDFSIDRIAGKKVEKTTFMYFAGKCLSEWEKRRSPATITAYMSMLTQLRNFDRFVFIEDITPDWLARYEQHCRTECGDAGTLKRIAFVSVIIKEAIRKDIVQKDPFIIYKKPPKKNPPKIWLTVNELGRIEKLAETSPSDILRNTAYWFLLSCYTGLRYSDIEKFNAKKMIQEGRMVLYTQKTGEVVSIKLTRKLKDLIRKVGKLPAIYSNQKANQYLKAIAHVCKIDKVLTFHTGRHTFAVQCANLGISQEVTAKLLGQSDLRTTAIYYKITNTRVDNEMKKWEK